MMAASVKLDAVAERVASYGSTTQEQSQAAAGGGGPVRIAYLPLPGGIPDATEDLTTMMEAEHSFKFNAVVFTTAADMLKSLYDAVD
jgi:flagellar basal body rod protein FlgC